MVYRSAIAILICGALSACVSYTPRDIANPKEITLKDALIDISDSLQEVKKRTRPDEKIGLIVDEATIVFDIKASATDKNEGKISVDNATLPFTTLGGTYLVENTSEAHRGNTITIKLKNVCKEGCLPVAKTSEAKTGEISVTRGGTVIMQKPNQTK